MDNLGAQGAETAPDAETLLSIRIQADEHPLIDDVPSTSIDQHIGRLMHLKAYEVASGLATGVDVLDVGCNTGYGTMMLAETARRVVGVDVSPRAIEVASAAARDGRPEFRAIDGLALPFADGSFDLVTSFQVIEHVLDPQPYLREMARVLRAGGSLVLTTPNAVTRLDPGMSPWNPFHVREYVAAELAAALGAVFPNVRIRGMFGTPTLYEAELARVDATRRRARARIAAAASAAQREARGPGRRSLAVRVARRGVPSVVRARLRRLRGRAGVSGNPEGVGTPSVALPRLPVAVAPTMDLETFLRFSPADLFYADTDLDRAMDFMAICRRA